MTPSKVISFSSSSKVVSFSSSSKVVSYSSIGVVARVASRSNPEVVEELVLDDELGDKIATGVSILNYEIEFNLSPITIA